MVLLFLSPLSSLCFGLKAPGLFGPLLDVLRCLRVSSLEYDSFRSAEVRVLVHY